ncbi:carboxypeptidase-like regulatory domain-containing protein [Flammeovirga aprica]|uniref:Carboxypeptidase-like regulatory domain-containing protein n=1 Tax=Flammeovirga aprica JL-4 TaxID=694437 RepID=A0A7X9XDE6_9BACT|nr:carboxypeptidase-like regulatory domain-containing protein [Flammeovirga aprica]NME72718.1 carboxypeptidase-like regulatory domain-containing protein [Flammeovirga aprica JL-4]
MWKQYSIIVFIFYSFNLFGQEKSVSGDIKSVSGDVVPFANIIAYPKEDMSKPITYGFSNSQGQFSLKIPSDLKAITINVTAIGFKEKTVALQLNGQSVEITLEESITELKEVVVELREETDTLNLDTEHMNLSKESTLREMLNKTDGVIIGDEGTISYQGKQINKVLINGKEVFINQNKVALDNLNYEIMKNVQIIDNYKDKFTLDFKRIQDPVINIDTKEEFKGVVKAQIDAGIGYTEKFAVKGKGFFFSDKLNSFATTNTNNVGEKELGQKDVTSSVLKYATGALNNTLRPFFMDDSRTFKSFVSNSNLTTRWQGLNSKTGVVFYYGNIQTERKIDINTIVADVLTQGKQTENIHKGNFISVTANHSRILSKKTVFQNVLSAMTIDQQGDNKSFNTLYIPEVTTFTELNQNRPKNFTLSNALKITHLLSDNIAFDLNVDYFNERNTRDFTTLLTNINFPDLSQEEMTSKQLFSTLANLQFRFKKASLKAGIHLSKNLENGHLTFNNDVPTTTSLERGITILDVPLSLSGSINKLDYTFSATPTLIHTQKTQYSNFFKMHHSLTYNFETQNTLGISAGRDYRFYNLHVLFDTMMRSYNQIIINNRDYVNQYATRDEASLSWFNNNVARSKSNHIIYRYTREQDFLQNVLDSISNNVFYYSNQVFDKKETHSLSSGYQKGFYIGKSYHLLKLDGKLDYTYNNYTTSVNSVNTPSRSDAWVPSLNISFLPRSFFIKEVSNELNYNHMIFWLNNEEINRQSVITNTFSVRGHGNKTTWNVNFIFTKYSIENTEFNVPDLHLSYKYDLSDRLSFSLVGQSLLTLFKLNNYNYVNTISSGNTLTQIATNNNLGYLLLTTSIKL